MLGEKKARGLKHKHTEERLCEDMGRICCLRVQESFRRIWSCCPCSGSFSLQCHGAVCLCDLNHPVTGPAISRKVTQRWDGH